MSYDSVRQLLEARSGYFTDAHPPMMAELWRWIDAVIAGPVGILLLQSTIGLAALYVLFRRRMSERAAAWCSIALLLSPLFLVVFAVIWKDALMTAFLLLGTALVLDERRRVRLAALGAFVLATGMRHNALFMTMPLVVILFTWHPSHTWWKRYAVAVVAWIAVTATSMGISKLLTDESHDLWSESLALCDMTSTLRFVTPDIPDDELRRELAGTHLKVSSNLHAFTRQAPFVTVDDLWSTAYSFFEIPTTPEEKQAVGAAWKRIVLGHPGAYLHYRLAVFSQLLQLGSGPVASPAYVWFVDVQNIDFSAKAMEHDAGPGKIQHQLRDWMFQLGTTAVFRVFVYVALVIVLLLVGIRDRVVFALCSSALVGEAALFLITPTTDWRYSFWTVVVALVAGVLVVARRVRRGG